MEKAYKLLAKANNISHNEAKMLIDRGLVSVNGMRIKIARMLLRENTKFHILQQGIPQVILHTDDFIAINKPSFVNAQEVLSFFEGYKLINRLDRETSGIMLLGTQAFLKQAIDEFKHNRVYKEYRAIVCGLFKDDRVIDTRISTQKGQRAFSRIDKNGQEAYTFASPIQYLAKKTLLKIIIKTGRTHQIRVHLASIGFPLLGDTLYGGKDAKRLFLHAYKMNFLGHEIIADLPQEFMLE